MYVSLEKIPGDFVDGANWKNLARRELQKAFTRTHENLPRLQPGYRAPVLYGSDASTPARLCTIIFQSKHTRTHECIALR